MTAADPTARFAELVSAPEAQVPLDEAAMLIAAHAQPDLDVGAELGRLDELAAACSDRSFEGWRRFVFDELGFAGTDSDYYDPANSFLNEVVRRRTGIPITLSVVGMELGRRIGVPLVGIGMPGHFLLRHEGDPAWFVDAYAGGRLLDEAGCEARFRDLHGREAPFDPGYVQAVGTRAILGRMLANLKTAYGRRHELEPLRWVIQLRLALPETPVTERHQLAHVLTASGRYGAAAAELETLAAALPERAEELLRQAVGLRARLN